MVWTKIQQFISTQYESVSSSINNSKDEFSETNTEVKRLTSGNLELNKVSNSLLDDIIDLKCHSMRDNLLFIGIPESSETSDGIFANTGDQRVQYDATSGTAETTTSCTTGATCSAPTLQQRNDTTENCEQKVHTFLTKVLKIEESRGKVRVDRAHRIGPYRANRTTPIVAKFVDTTSKLFVKDQLRSVNLRQTSYNVTDQYPHEVQQRRRDLIPVMIQARKGGKRASLVRDKLFINNREYVPPPNTN